METPRVLLDGLAYVESPRWHEGRLWFAHWGTGEVVAVSLDGRSEVVPHGPPGLGWSIDWLPDGRLLVTGPELLRQEPDGSMVTHADLGAVADHRWNEIVVDGRGNIYVNGFGFDFLGGEPPEPGIIALVAADGTVRRVADDIEFPNGMVVTPDNSTLIVSESFAERLTAFDIGLDGGLSNRRVWADNIGPDGICLDADGAIWTQAADTRPTPDAPTPPTARAYASKKEARCCNESNTTGDLRRMLGGPDRRNLFMLAAECEGPTTSRAQSRRGRDKCSSRWPRCPAPVGRERGLVARQRHQHRRAGDQVERQAQQAAPRPAHRRRLVDDRRVGFSNASAFGMKSTSDHSRITAWLTNATKSAVRAALSPQATTSVTTNSRSNTVWAGTQKRAREMPPLRGWMMPGRFGQYGSTTRNS